MPVIKDVSPKDLDSVDPSVSGRMLSIACAPDGGAVYAGSYSNLWASHDAGQHFEQLVWPQPPVDQFSAPGSLGGWCVVDIAVATGWRVEMHPRVLAQLSPGQHASLVGFGDCGVWTALGHNDGSFQPPTVALSNFGYNAGGWRVDRHPRFVVDLTGDGRADIIGFGDDGVWTALGNGDGTFQEPHLVQFSFGYNAGGWRVEQHPRFLAVLTSSGYPDIVGFGDDGVWTALGNGDGTFQDPHLVQLSFGYNAGGWRVEQHPRFLTVLTGSGYPDIVGFGDDGVWTALGNGDGTFQDPHLVQLSFGYNAGGWRVEQHPRFVVDLTGDGRADIIGFGDDGVWTALGNGDGTFQDPHLVQFSFGYNAGGWRVEQHPRSLAVLTGGGYADIVGFGDAGVWTALGNGDGSFRDAKFVLANFGYGSTVLALTVNDRVVGATKSRGIWRSTDGGANWTQAYQFPSGETAGQLQWALGSDHLVYAAGGSALAISKNGGTTFESVFPWGINSPQRVNHVAVWQNDPADKAPVVIYVLGNSAMALSFDGGVAWMPDQGNLPPNVGGAVGSGGNSNTPTVMVISPRSPLEVYVTVDANAPPALWRGDYSQFPFGSQQSTWDPVVAPDLTNYPQDNGNVFLATSQKGRGDLLFYGPQRSAAFVGPLFPQSPSDWHALDSNVHPDLHGVLLSPDFSAKLEAGDYGQAAGTIWLLSDGGIYRSTDGGKNFNSVPNVQTLSCVKVAGVSERGKGPALSLNTGDNDGFYSMDGGEHWAHQQYGGGDNDGAFADPLRARTMLVFTPRWNSAGDGDITRRGQTVSVYQTDPGKLPDCAAGTHDRRAVTGPPPLPDSAPSRDIWNAGNPVPQTYVARGSRPIVLGLPGEDAPTQGDYIFILNPTTTQPVLVRTQNILDIVHRGDWVTVATAPGQGANVYLQGPPLPPSANLGVAQASGGHTATVFYVGDCGLNVISSLWRWTEGAAAWAQIVPSAPIPNVSVGARQAVRFFVSPYQPTLIYILDRTGVKRSDDGGQTWQADDGLQKQLTWNGQLPISTNGNSSGIGDQFDLILTDMQWDPFDPLRRFAVGEGGVFMTTDGATWIRLLHTGALAGRPANCYYDAFSTPEDPALYVAFAGRGLLKITQLQEGPFT